MSDLFEMLEDVRRHVLQTGRRVEADDSPLDRAFGYRDGEHLWRISLTDVKCAKAEAKDAKQAAWAEMFHTPEGRKRLVDPIAIAFQEVWSRLNPKGATAPYISRTYLLGTLADILSWASDCESWIIAVTTLAPATKSFLVEEWGEHQTSLASLQAEVVSEKAEAEATEVIRFMLDTGRLRELTQDGLLVPA